MSATESSSFEKLLIESNDQKNTVDLRAGIVSIDYYEDILSPSITAKVRIIDTVNTTLDAEGKERQGLVSGLPLRGGERLSMKILDQGTTGNGEEKKGLDFSTDPEKNLFVSSVTQVLQDTQRESFLLNLVSREAITNETTRVYKRYKNTISDSVKKILTDPLIGLDVDKSKLDEIVEKTKGTYNFLGNLRKPFSLLISLASKSIPDKSGGATAGFVFFQTQDGFHFKSIDTLINKESKATYIYNETSESSITTNNDFRILKFIIDKNQDLIDNLRMGAYVFNRLTFDPRTFQFKQSTHNYFEKNKPSKKDTMNHLGREKIILPEQLTKSPSRVLAQVVDVGATSEISNKSNYDIDDFLGQNIMRYNILNTQNVSMTVPCNTDLRAGDVIDCRFPKMSKTDNEGGDDIISGRYLIKELCHHFEANRSFTSMKLIRDTVGRVVEVES
tara:strand:+ start:267 stop:1604 length:1338 start_codon:yes stop_codon:yes gene_type:complete